MNKLINISNHPSDKWGEAQSKAAKEFADVIIDRPFPSVPPRATADEVNTMALEIANEISGKYTPVDTAVHIMGEMTLTAAVVAYLQQNGFECVASCTERIVTELENGNKLSKFEFVKFRQYCVPEDY